MHTGERREKHGKNQKKTQKNLLFTLTRQLYNRLTRFLHPFLAQGDTIYFKTLWIKIFYPQKTDIFLNRA